MNIVHFITYRKFSITYGCVCSYALRFVCTVRRYFLEMTYLALKQARAKITAYDLVEADGRDCHGWIMALSSFVFDDLIKQVEK